MPGGRGKIRPEDRTNGFEKRPEAINRNGAPRKLPDLDKILADVLGKEDKGRTAAEMIIEALKSKAYKGDVRAAEVLMDRAYGKSVEKHEHQFTKGIKLIFTDDDTDS